MPAPPPDPVHSRRVLFEAPGLAVSDFRCSAPVEPEGAEEPNLSDSIVFVRRGVFSLSHRHETFLADPASVLFFSRDEPYRYAHPLPGGDECTILSLSPALAREAVARHAPADSERREGPFRHGRALSSARSTALQYELLALLAERPLGIAVEDLLAEIVDESVRAAYADRGGDPPREGNGLAARRRHRDLAEAARLALNARLADPPALGELARSLGCSPFHLSRLFRRVTGLPLRRHLARLRARAAAERIAGGTRDLTRLALELGFADHAHFTRAFRAEWGLPPSRFRERLRAVRARA
jgi:AraC-like DNA-binding protein